jgi:60 kDa SS-A/Ro ribonucleoprotein
MIIGLDVSGSMCSPITGARGRGHVSKMRCVDAAALFASAVLRRNPQSVIIPFDTSAHNVTITPSDSILSLAARLSNYGGGGTDCSVPLATANSGRYRDRKFAGCVLVSDCESWVGEGRYGSTAVMTAWGQFLANQARLGQSPLDLKLICIDLQPYTTVQAPDRGDILNVGGFSDAVFQVVDAFMRNPGSGFVAEVEAIEL